MKVQRKMAPKMRQGSQIVESHVASEIKTKLRGKGKTALEVKIMKLHKPSFLPLKVQ